MALDRKGMPRKYTPDAMWIPLAKLLNSHFDDAIQFEDWVNIWEPKRLIWDQVMDNLRMQGDGRVYGNIATFHAFRFIESLAVDNDVYFRLSAALLSAPLIDNFVNQGGFIDSVEDFFLKQYNRAPTIYQGTSSNRILIQFPGFIHRLTSGYPSPRRFRRDFLKLTAGIWSVEFTMAMDGDVLILEGYLPEGSESEPHNPGFVQTGRELLKMASKEAIYG